MKRKSAKVYLVNLLFILIVGLVLGLFIIVIGNVLVSLIGYTGSEYWYGFFTKHVD